MKRTLGSLWNFVVAIHCSHATRLAPPSLAFAFMPLVIGNGFVKKALFEPSTRHVLSRNSRQLSTLPLTSKPKRAHILQCMATSSSASSRGRRTRASPPAAGVQRGGRGSSRRSSSAPVSTSSARRSYVSSDYRGVVGGPKGKWKARISSKGGLQQLGTFGCELDAARAYNKAARTLHGSAAKLNSLPEEADAKTGTVQEVTAEALEEGGIVVTAKLGAGTRGKASKAKVGARASAAEAVTEHDVMSGNSTSLAVAVMGEGMGSYASENDGNLEEVAIITEKRDKSSSKKLQEAKTSTTTKPKPSTTPAITDTTAAAAAAAAAAALSENALPEEFVKNMSNVTMVSRSPTISTSAEVATSTATSSQSAKSIVGQQQQQQQQQESLQPEVESAQRESKPRSIDSNSTSMGDSNEIGTDKATGQMKKLTKQTMYVAATAIAGTETTPRVNATAALPTLENSTTTETIDAEVASTVSAVFFAPAVAVTRVKLTTVEPKQEAVAQQEQLQAAEVESKDAKNSENAAIDHEVMVNAKWSAGGAIPTAELSFRDLEEIPQTSGLSLWDDMDGDPFAITSLAASVMDDSPAHFPLLDDPPIDFAHAATETLEREERRQRQHGLLPMGFPAAFGNDDAPSTVDRLSEVGMSIGQRASETAATAAMTVPTETADNKNASLSLLVERYRPARGLQSSPGLSQELPALAEQSNAVADSTASVFLPPILEEDIVPIAGAGHVSEDRGGNTVAQKESGDAYVGRTTLIEGAARTGGWERNNTVEDFYEARLKEVVDVSQGLDRYWMEPLMSLTKPEARKVAMQLSSANKLGYVSTRGGPVGKGSLLEFVLAQKEKHPTKVLLTRVGEFYETYGVDAVMMMQHAGLNRMGQEVRAGCPRKNVQQTLDGLTSAGLTVAVYEEVNDVNSQRGPSVTRARIKERALTQVLSPGSPNYLYEGCLRTDDISFRESKPYVGVMRDSSGYLLCQIYADEREVQVSERLTEEAVRVCMEEAGVAEPVFDQGTGLKFLPDHTEQLTGFPSAAFPGQVLARVAGLLELATSDLDHFRTVTRTPEGRPRAVYPSTALQIGLLKNNNVPDLVPCLLPAGYPAVCHRFLRKWLLLPPSYRLADSAHELCQRLASPDQAGLPSLHAVPVGKAKALLLDRQCNVPFFREIHECVRGMLDMLGENSQQQPEADEIASRGAPFQPPGMSNFMTMDEDPDDILTGGAGDVPKGGDVLLSASPGSYSSLVPPLLDLVGYQSGVVAVEHHLRRRARAVISAIEAVVAASSAADDITSDPDGLVPESFWRNNEGNFRGSLSLEHEATQKAYRALDAAASELCKAVKEDFPNAAQDLTFDIHNNAIYLTKLPSSGKLRSSSSRTKTNIPTASWNEDGKDRMPAKEQDRKDEEEDEEEGRTKTVFLNPHDRNGKLLSKRFTTRKVTAALSEYLSAVQDTENTVKLELQALSDVLVRSNDLPVIAQAAHWSVICQAMEGHVRHSLASGWSLPKLKSPADPDMSMQVKDMVPYWLPREEAVPNSFDFRGLFLLTAPNMSGKSTLMRAVLACSLLGNAGLFTPSSAAVIPRYDGFFLRTASYDIPAEDKSAFALEMDDVRVMLRDSSRRSLALVDELGKGTSARDGAALAGALLEEMDRVSITGIFATHLHELFDLPLKTKTMSCKRMGIDWSDSDHPKWTYTLEDGKCTNSLALQTARRYNIPGTIIARAEALSVEFDRICRGVAGAAGVPQDGGKVANPIVVGAPEEAAAATAASRWREEGRAAAAPTAEARGEDWWPSDGKGWGDGPGRARKIEDAARVVCSIVGCKEKDMAFVPSGYGTPPALEGRSCLYVLRYAASLTPRNEPRNDLQDRLSSSRGVAAAGAGSGSAGGAKSTAAEEALDAERDGGARSRLDDDCEQAWRGWKEEGGVWFYVGESDVIRARLAQHRNRWGISSTTVASSLSHGKLDAIVVAMENKSSARRYETALIRAMKERGFHLISDKDGSRVNPSFF